MKNALCIGLFCVTASAGAYGEETPQTVTAYSNYQLPLQRTLPVEDQRMPNLTRTTEEKVHEWRIIVLLWTGEHAGETCFFKLNYRLKFKCRY